ncbi:hypothetical protein MYAM1_002751 [Malassezia yamatoensis]|uniref:Uracil permease n=1 Tax=Malassezia yamatoensis TaxID=253288 RepID=A0AAJ6CHL7_9BASI|nr:hypothetical protein MYAM1_002751 [Malassezia yamatoensis]
MSNAELQVANEDMMPVPPEKRTWGSMNYVNFWIADGFNLNTFTIASTLIVAGLNVWQSIVCVAIGYTLVGPLVVLSARPAAMHHLKFPAVCRTSFGMFGSYWPIINRAGMACIWSGVQAWLGGECVHVFLRTMWHTIDEDIPNKMPANTQTTSAYILCFVINWLLMLPTIWVPLHQLRHLFTVKAVIGPIVGFALFGWCVSRAGKTNVFNDLNNLNSKQLAGSALVWQMLRGIAVSFNNMFTLIVNASDFGSPARKPSAVIWPQLVTIPMVFIVTSFIGIVIAKAAQVQYNEPMWDVVKIMNRMLDPDQNPTAGTRTGLWFISAGFIYVQLLTNVSANTLAAGCDLTALFPRFINIRRGGYIAALVSIVMNPWMLYTSSSQFSSYLGAFSVLLSCIAGPMFADYFLIRRGHYNVADLYSLDKKGWYWYTLGINWRAYAGYFVGFGLNAPGFLATCNDSIKISDGWMHVFDLAWISGTGSSALVYVICCLISPPRGMNRHFKEVDESNFSHEFAGAYNYGGPGEAYEDMLEAPKPINEENKTASPESDKPSISNEEYKY